MHASDSLVLRARRDLRWYLGLVALFSLVVQVLIFCKGGMTQDAGLLILLLMWTPGLVAFALRMAFKQGVRDVSFGLGARGARLAPYLVAWLSPVVVGVVAYGAAWGWGLVEFDAARLLANKHAIAGHPVVTLGKGLIMLLTMYLPVGAAFAAGEEFGWRGYMLTRLVDARVPHPVLASGVIWGLWHMPLILSGQYVVGPSIAVSSVGFMVCVVGGGGIAAWVRLRSGSVWPAVVFHASWNAVIQGAFDPVAVGVKQHSAAAYWLGESGALVALCVALLAWLLWRRPVVMLRSLTEPAS